MTFRLTTFFFFTNSIFVSFFFLTWQKLALFRMSSSWKSLHWVIAGQVNLQCQWLKEHFILLFKLRNMESNVLLFCKCDKMATVFFWDLALIQMIKTNLLLCMRDMQDCYIHSIFNLLSFTAEFMAAFKWTEVTHFKAVGVESCSGNNLILSGCSERICLHFIFPTIWWNKWKPGPLKLTSVFFFLRSKN